MNNTNQFGLPDEPPEGTELIDNEKFSRKAVTARISPEDIENVLNKLDFFDKTITPTKTFRNEEEKQNYITSTTLEDIAKRINPDLIEGRRYAEPVTEEERKLACGFRLCWFSFCSFFFFCFYRLSPLFYS